MGAGAIKVYIPCDAAAKSVGADEVALAVKEAAQKHRVSIEIIRNGSRGMLWLEPLVEVETPKGRAAFGPLTKDDVDGLFSAGFLSGGKHELSLGLTEEISYFAKQQRITFSRCGVIDPLDIDAYKNHGGITGLEKALGMAPAEIVDVVTRSGLRGRGGAGFPAGIKWKTALEAPSDKKYICCNADEGDSGTFADRMLMEGDPFSLLEGMVIAGLAVGADEGFIYLRSEYPDAIATMRKAITAFREAGYLGQDITGSGRAFEIHLRRGAGSYVCGEETAMLESLEGRRGHVRAKPPLPAIEGLFGKPTIINNVLTLATAPAILANGADHYQSLGMDRSRGTQPIQLAGNVKQGGLIELPFGATLREIVEDFGGGTRSGRPVRAVQVGGPLGAYYPPSMFDLPFDYETFAQNGGIIGHGGVVVFDDTVDMAQQAEFAFDFCAIESCGKCTPCRIGSVRGRELVEKLRSGSGNRAEEVALIEDLCEVLTDGSLCAMGGLTPLPVLSALRHFEEDFDRQ